MYLDEIIFKPNEYNNLVPKTIKLICDKCNKIIEFDFDYRYDGWAITTNKDGTQELYTIDKGSTVVCECGNVCQNGMIYQKSIAEKMEQKEKNAPSQPTQTTPPTPPKNVPTCPICKSTNLTKISTAKKIGKIGLFGIFGAGDVGKTYKCNSCGSKF